MKVVNNADGTVTVSIPKSDELYDPERGGLHVAETLSKDDFEAARKGKEGPEQPDTVTAKAIADEEARLSAGRQNELERHAAEAATQQLARDKAQSQAVTDQRIASEKARLSEAANVRNAQVRADSALAGAPFVPSGTGAEKAAADIHKVAEAVGTKSDKRETTRQASARVKRETTAQRAATKKADQASGKVPPKPADQPAHPAPAKS